MNSETNPSVTNETEINQPTMASTPKGSASAVPTDVKDFLEAYYPNGLVYLHNTFLAYSGGYWKKQLDRADIQKAITRFYASSATPAKVKSLFELLKLTNAVKHDEFKPDTNFICFTNGCLNMTTYELVQHNQDYHLLSGRNFAWNPEAKSPLFEKFLNDIFRDDEDREDKIRFLIEWMGLCLIPNTQYEKFVVCVGEGGNGKSVLLKLMPELVGYENVYSAPIERLGNRRALAELQGKLLLTSSEINENSEMDDGILKQIVSGDMIEGERKYEPPFTFKPYARIMLATNHLPKLRDVTHAFFRRLVLIKFNRNFTADEMDMNLLEKLKAELAGIFVTVINGLRTLTEREQFVVPESSRQASEQYLEDADTIKLFASEALINAENESKGMKPVAVYSLYSSWCAAHGITGRDKVSSIVLGKALSRMGYKKSRSNGADYWRVKISPIGDEITSKRSATVTTLPDPRL